MTWGILARALALIWGIGIALGVAWEVTHAPEPPQPILAEMTGR